MTAFESYKMYVALKLHFTTDSYDYFKFNGKTRVSETNFEEKGQILLQKTRIVRRMMKSFHTL